MGGKECGLKDRPAKCGDDDACIETIGSRGADRVVCGTAVVGCVIGRVEAGAGLGMANLSTKNPSTRANGIYFGNLGSIRRFL